MRLRQGLVIFFICSLGFSWTSVAEAQEFRVDRPPQYILLAFDGSLNLDMWSETLVFAKENDLNFTYFISGVYFLLDSNKQNYTEPTHGVGKSAIGWGGDSKEHLKSRVDYVNEAFDEGNEIGSHVNGHFDGSLWTLAEWESEFKQFYHLIFDVFQLNDINKDPFLNPYHFKPQQIIGFRSPLLGHNENMYKVLNENHYAYDTSQTAPMTYWPEIKNGVWNFPLAEVRIAGTGIRTLSMDYNFYYAQSGGNPAPENAAEYKAQMLDTYLGYFETNYYGNRAPVHIGHHFSKWNAGAYWEAMQEFVKTVCIMPEVKCVTYRDLLGFMNSRTPEMLEAYRKGNFPKLENPEQESLRSAAVAPMDVKINFTSSKAGVITASLAGVQAALFQHKNIHYIWKVNEQEIYRTLSNKVNIGHLVRFLQPGRKLSVSYQHRGQELLKSSHRVLAATPELVQVRSEELEDWATAGDIPEAHKEK